MIRIQGFNHQLQKGSYPFTSLFVSLLPVSLLSDLTDEKYTRFQNPGIFSDFKFTYENKGMKKKRQDYGDVWLMIGLLCDRQDRK